MCFLVSADRVFGMGICWLKGMDICVILSKFMIILVHFPYNFIREIQKVEKSHLRSDLSAAITVP